MHLIEPPMSTTMTLRIEDDVKERLDRLADATQRSKSFLAAEAIREFVENNEWQIREIKAALKEAHAGDFASNQDVAALAKKWKLRTALRNLDAEAGFIAEDDPAAARLVVERVLTAVAMLAAQPNLGRPGRVPNTRELVVVKTRYIVPYRVRRDSVEVLRVFHTSRRPPQKW